MNLQTPSPVGPAKWFQPLQVMIATHSSVAEAAGLAGETWGFNSWPGEGWKKQKMTPYIWKVWCFLLVPLAPTALPFLPPTHTLIKRMRISSYAVLGNRLESRRRCNQCVILLLGTSPMSCVQCWDLSASWGGGKVLAESSLSAGKNCISGGRLELYM